MPSFLLANQTVSLEEFSRIVYSKDNIDLDIAVVEKIRTANAKGASQRKTFTLPAIEYSGSYLNPLNTRAVVAGKLIALFQGNSHITLEHMSILAWFLNKDVLPLLPVSKSDSFVLHALALAMNGQGQFLKENIVTPLSEAFQQHGQTSVSFSEREFATFTQGCSVTSSLAALATYGAKSLAGSADAIAAITCEATQAFTEPFQTAHTDTARPLKGIVKSANHLRQLLEGSKEVNSRTTVKTIDPEAIRSIPQQHGPVVNSLAHIAIDAKVELNATEDGPFDSSAKSGGPFHPQPARSILMSVLHDISVLANASASRVRFASETTQFLPESVGITTSKAGFVSEQCATYAAPASALSEVSVEFPVSVLESVDATLQILATELHLSLTVLSEREQKAIKQQLEKLEAKEKAAAARAAATGKDGASSATEGKKKEKEKEKKKVSGLNLGKGTSIYRNQVLGRTGEEDSDVSAETPSVDTLLQRIHAFDVTYSNWVENQLLATSNQIRKPKIPKGTRDFMPFQMAIRQKAFSTITDVFKRHGAVTIDTPVFELKETLTGKYGEDSKLIYDLADQGGEILSLRYDLTVPFARFCATYGIANIKRYHISRVYRRDNPATNRGRFREFYQCDFDIAGHYGLMLPDSEVLKILTEILDELEIGRYEVKLNHRKLLDGILEVAGVPASKFRTICSSIDKLDKEPWSAVKAEMVEEKGVTTEVADIIGKYVCLRDAPPVLLEKLTTSEEFRALNENPSAKSALDEFKILFQYLKALGAIDKIVFDLSLARGLDYYTGVIYEAVFTESNLTGSIAGGGRYDNLVGMFNPSGRQVPAVGVSIGIERIFTIMEDKFKQTDVRTTETQVLVASAGSNMAEERMRLCAELWGSKIKAEMLYSVNPKMQEQIEYAIEQKIPFMVTIGENEVREGIVQLKEVATKKQDTVQRSTLVEELQKRIKEAAV